VGTIYSSFGLYMYSMALVVCGVYIRGIKLSHYRLAIYTPWPL